jgi:serine/threonine-protein kinase
MIGRVIGNRYEVVRLIGKGGMGSIYEVRNTRLGRSFALKTLSCDGPANDKALQRFRREADVIARIKHPNIVDIIDWETLEDGSPAMVMEYLRGEDLGTRLERGPLAWPVIARIADQLLSALSVAHANGIVHRDLKPQNVFLAVDDTGAERVKLLDFGVSKVRDSRSIVTTDERLLGTPAYMSPEQADARPDDIDTPSDVWAMGVLLHEMATGEVPFDAPSVPSILYKICHGTSAPLLERRPDAPAAFVDVVAATFVRDIAGRIPDAYTLRSRLREALRGVEGVQYADALPARDALVASLVSQSLSQSSTSTRTLGSATSDVPSPTMIARRKLAPVAVALGCAAAAVVGIAISLAARDRPARPTPSASLVQPEPAAAVPDAAVAVEIMAPAATAQAPAAVADVPPPPAPAPRVTNKRKPDVTPASTTGAPPAVEVPVVAPKKKPCAKDDVVCLYGDGT